MSTRYFPRQVPNTEDINELISFIRDELNTVSFSINDNITQQLNELDVEPAKKALGMIRYADGTNWNPGAGAGVYVYTGVQWEKL